MAPNRFHTSLVPERNGHNMKNRRICRLLAMMLVLMLATPCLAMAEEEIVAEPTAQAALPEEIGEGMPELAEEPDGAQEEIVVDQA